MSARTMQAFRTPRSWALQIPKSRYVYMSTGNVGRKELALMKTELARMHGKNIDPDESIRVTRSGRITKTPSATRPKQITAPHTPSHIIPKTATFEAVRFEYVPERETDKGTDGDTDEESDSLRHIREEWRLEAWPATKMGLSEAMPYEKVIFIDYERNNSSPDALENRLLDAHEREKYDEIANLAERLLREDSLDSFTIVDSIPIPKQPPPIDLPFDLPIIPYSSLTHVSNKALWSGLEISKRQARRLVMFNEEVCIYRAAELPRDVVLVTEELKKFTRLSDSKSFADIVGKVLRESNIEAFLIRYSSKGSLALRKTARETTKRSWIMQIAKAFAEAESAGVFSLPLHSNGIVLDDAGNIKIVDLEKAKFADPNMEDPNSTSNFSVRTKQPILKEKSRLVNEFGNIVCDLFDRYSHRRRCDDEHLEVWIRSAPKWVQILVRGCGIDERFKSMPEIVAYLEE